LQYTQMHMRLLKKVPTHLAVIVDDEILLKEIASMICWCIGGGIQYITVYDMKGRLKQCSPQLQRIAKEKCSSFLGSLQYSEVDLNFYTLPQCDGDMLHGVPSDHPINNTNNMQVNNSSKNYDSSSIGGGGSKNQSYHIYIANAVDGRTQIANVAYHHCKEVYEEQQITTTTTTTTTPIVVNQAYMHANLKGFKETTPDPDLILNFDSSSSMVMSGFMPWHIHLTEILHMGSLQDITLQQFVRALYTYSKTDRRHGT